MKKSVFSLLLCAGVFSASSAFAITPEEIIDGYFVNTGGKAKWQAVTGVKFVGEMKQGQMAFPFVGVQMKDGRSYFQVEVQGKILKQNVWDGKQLWSTNFMTMKAELADAETTANFKLNLNDFPDPLLGYKEKGYKVELLGEETKDGTEVYKLKVVKEPVMVDGKSVEDVTYHYFDKEALVPLVQESEIKTGPAKGMMSQTKMGEYQEVDGLMFPFAMSQGVKDGQSAPMVFSKIELNPTVVDADFAMPKAE